MNSLRRHIRQITWRIAAAAALCALLLAAHGCAPAEGPETPAASALCRASLLISVGNQSTRAPQEGDYEAGTVAENHIDIEGGDFRIMLFDADDTLLCSLSDIRVNPLSEGEKIYEASGLLDPAAVAQARTAVKAVMLANWKGSYPEVTPGVTTIASLAAASEAAFDFETDGVPGARVIPMFGVSNLLEGLPFAEGEATQLGTLHLLRAYAKVRVRCAPESLPIESVSITLANGSAMLAPAGVSTQDDYVTGAYVSDYTSLPTLPAGVRAVADVPLVASGEEEWTLYIPEFRNTVAGTGSSELSDAARARLSVSFTGAAGTYYVDFRYYSTPPAWSGASEGDFFDLLRNNIYDFTLSKAAGETDISVLVDVQPYASVAVRPELGLDRDEEGYIILERYEDGTYKILTDAGEIIRDKDGDRLLRYFSDGSLLCEEIVYRDYIHDETESDYYYIFEKDASGGNMVILRESSDCSACTGDSPHDVHDHKATDRPLFVADKDGTFFRVVYPEAPAEDGKKVKPLLSRLDKHGDTLIQANGYQLRDIPDLRRYIGTYVVKVADKTAEGGFREELRRYSDGVTLDWDTLLPATRSLRPAKPGRALLRLRSANAEVMRKYGRLLNP